MPKKKKLHHSKKYTRFKTRRGFYSLVGLLIIIMFGSIKLVGSDPTNQDVLGEKSGKEGNSEAKRQEQEEKRELKNEQIRKEYKVEPKELRVKFESQDGQLKKEVEIKTIPPRKAQLKNEEKLIDAVEEDFTEETETEIASGSSEVELKKNKVRAKSEFPLSIDVATNQLSITRPDGTVKNVAILPDQAVQNFMRHKKVNLLNVVPPDTGSGSASTDPSLAPTMPISDGDTSGSGSAMQQTEQTQISLIERDNKLVYKIQGKKKLRVLGLIPVNTDTTGYVSAETGDVVGQEESIMTRFLNFLSF